jgi:DNA repair protein RadC
MRLYTKGSNGRYKEAGLNEVAEAYIHCTAGTVGSIISSPTDTKQFLKARLSRLGHEAFCVIYLTNRHMVIAFDELFRGTIDTTAVYPREILKEVLAKNAAAIILAHNHPSGVPEPSEADKLITKRIRDACEMIEVRVLDHFIIGRGEPVSLAERGLL